MQVMPKIVFWLWLTVLFALNIVPIGNETSKILSTRLWSSREIFRIDYLLHLISLLAFAWVVVLGKVTRQPVFKERLKAKYSVIVVMVAVGFEIVQFLLPSRKFNLVDMAYNLMGALLGVGVVFVSCRLAQIND